MVVAKETTDNNEELIEIAEEELVLTTKDNPFNPKTEYEKWKQWDEDNGYYTEAYLSRIADIPGDVDIDDDVLISLFVNEAIMDILDNDPLNIYVLV